LGPDTEFSHRDKQQYVKSTSIRLGNKCSGDRGKIMCDLTAEKKKTLMSDIWDSPYYNEESVLEPKYTVEASNIYGDVNYGHVDYRMKHVDKFV
jgi:hypothetical protein